MNDAEVLLTIFTPAFNRATLLPRLFQSLRAAFDTSPGCVDWLIFDDGSTDDTSSVIATFQSSYPQAVKGIRSENGGKHRAINSAVAARGRWIMILDSDDWLEEGVIGDIINTLAAVEGDKRIGMVRAFRRFVDRPTPASFGVEGIAAHSDWVDHFPIFDTAEIVRASVLKEFPFPDFPREKFMAESWLWNSIATRYLTWFVNRPWTVCEYQPEGLSARSRQLRIQSPRGAMAVYATTYYGARSRKRRLKAAINWWRFRLHAGSDAARDRRPVPLMFAPLGWVLARWDRRAASSEARMDVTR